MHKFPSKISEMLPKMYICKFSEIVSKKNIYLKTLTSTMFKIDLNIYTFTVGIKFLTTNLVGTKFGVPKQAETNNCSV